MKKVITFSLILALTSPLFVGCKSGTSCFARNGSRIPTSSVSDYDDGYTTASTSSSPRVINAGSSGEVVMMNTTSAASQCAPCAPTACNPCTPVCNPCTNAQTSSSGYPAGAYSQL